VIFTSCIKTFIPPVTTPTHFSSHDYKLQIEAARSFTVLTEYLSKDSLYRETGWGKLSGRRERRKLCLMYNMYHGHAPSYLCDLLPPLVRDVTNHPVRNRNDYKMSRIIIPIFVHPVCHKSLEQSRQRDQKYQNIWYVWNQH